MKKLDEDLPQHIASALVDASFTDDVTEEVSVLLVGNATDLASALSEWAREHGRPVPKGLAVERGDNLSAASSDESPLQFFSAEFITSDFGQFEHVIVAPPHMRARELFDITELRDRFPQLHGSANAATVYLLHGLNHLTGDGRLAILLPPRFLTSSADADVRRRLVEEWQVTTISPIEVADDSLAGFIVVIEPAGHGPTETPSGPIELPSTGENWGPFVANVPPPADSDLTLEDVTEHIGPGIATGADDVFIVDQTELPPQIEDGWVYPIVGGGTLASSIDAPTQTPLRVICPYDDEGTIVPFDQLGEGVQAWLQLHEDTLRSRASIEGRGTPWYGWTHHPSLQVLRRPKILTRDFATDVEFWIDESGEVLPRRTVYYLIPTAITDLHDLYEYLQTEAVSDWLEATTVGGDRGHRIRTKDLQMLPVPSHLVDQSD